MVKDLRHPNRWNGETRLAPSWGKVLAVVSGRRGVGKSNLAVNLGVQFSRRGINAVLVDADSGLDNSDNPLNIPPRGNIPRLRYERLLAHDAPAEGPEGLRVIRGFHGVSRRGLPCEFDPSRSAAAMERLSRVCDVLLINCPPGPTPPVVSCALCADRLMVVATPEPTALADAYAMLKMLCCHGFCGRAGVVLNMVRSQEEATETLGRLRRATELFLGLTLENLGYVPSDWHVTRAARDRLPVAARYPRCAASCGIERVCGRISPLGAATGRPVGLWARVASLFL